MIAPPKPTIPAASIRVATSRRVLRPSSDPSAGIQNQAMASVTKANGTLTKNVVCHPHAPTSTPPTGNPNAAVPAPAIIRPPSTPPGGAVNPTLSARRRMSSIADG